MTVETTLPGGVNPTVYSVQFLRTQGALLRRISSRGIAAPDDIKPATFSRWVSATRVRKEQRRAAVLIQDETRRDMRRSPVIFSFPATTPWPPVSITCNALQTIHREPNFRRTRLLFTTGFSANNDDDFIAPNKSKEPIDLDLDSEKEIIDFNDILLDNASGSVQDLRDGPQLASLSAQSTR